MPPINLMAGLQNLIKFPNQPGFNESNINQSVIQNHELNHENLYNKNLQQGNDYSMKSDRRHTQPRADNFVPSASKSLQDDKMNNSKSHKYSMNTYCSDNLHNYNNNPEQTKL